MELKEENIKSLYFKYLIAAFGSAVISSIYSIVDMAMVGKYQGPNGTAALAVVAPVWNIIYSLGLLMGIGGSIIFSTIKGNKKLDCEKNQYFSASLIGSIILAIVVWICILCFENQILIFFGASDSLIILSKEYMRPIRYVVPLFLFNQMLAAFLRNDNNPQLATFGVLAGGIFNVFGDYIFVFIFNMGIYGAGLATAIGSIISFIVIMCHFISDKNTLGLEKPINLFKKLYEIFITGFSTFFIDVAMGILTILFNRQIMKYLGANALAIYGPIIQVSTFVQCCAYSVGQAAQPIISFNYGLKDGKRIKETLHLALSTTVFFGIFWTLFSMIYPNLYIRIFMTPTDEILKIAPSIIRTYSLSFLLLPLNIFSTYYFGAILKPKIAFVISISRGLIISGILIMILPTIFDNDSIWLTMPITEIPVMLYAIFNIYKYTESLPMLADKQFI